MRLVIYARVSVSTATDSLTAQETMCRQWCESAGHLVVGVHVDDGKSGTLPVEDRTGLAAALADVRRCHAHGIVTRDATRFGRESWVVQSFYKATWDAGGAIFTTEIGEVRGDTPEHQLITAVLTAVGAWERAAINVRLQNAAKRKRERGEYCGGGIPYGKRVENGVLVVNQEEMKKLRRVRRLRQQGKSLREISGLVYNGEKHPQSIARMVHA